MDTPEQPPSEPLVNASTEDPDPTEEGTCKEGPKECAHPLAARTDGGTTVSGGSVDGVGTTLDATTIATSMPSSSRTPSSIEQVPSSPTIPTWASVQQKCTGSDAAPTTQLKQGQSDPASGNKDSHVHDVLPSEKEAGTPAMSSAANVGEGSPAAAFPVVPPKVPSTHRPRQKSNFKSA